ncbi:SURF1 family protein [Pseudochelatococcus sp. B33]
MNGEGAGPDRPPWRSLLWPGVFTLAALAILVSLGVWQLQRLAWKEDLIARIEARTRAEPVALPPEDTWTTTRWEGEEYRPVLVSGTYLHAREVFVQANAVLGSGGARMGSFVLTPLRTDAGGVVFVNRGFIPVELRQDAAAFAVWQREDRAATDGPVTVAGLLRAPQQRGWFVPQDVPEKGEWFVRDPDAFAAALGLERVAPFTIDAFRNPERQGWPVGGLTVVSFPNNHLDYAFTWFGLGVVLAVIFALFARKVLLRGRGR